ncbi:kinase-like domain [Cordyceps militaris]|uniref:Kinase-like domain n=1 Tax=Cordyceps militaris TaxID=73501 RepID=A0A2H4S6I3_CORMI|nr:kinase-like domain [Cordyceps militaris]
MLEPRPVANTLALFFTMALCHHVAILVIDGESFREPILHNQGCGTRTLLQAIAQSGYISQDAASRTGLPPTPCSVSVVPSSGSFRPSPSQWPASSGAAEPQSSLRAAESASSLPIPTTESDGRPQSGVLVACSGPFTPATPTLHHDSLSFERWRRSHCASTPEARSISSAWPVPASNREQSVHVKTEGSSAWRPAPTPRPAESTAGVRMQTESTQRLPGLPSLPAHRDFTYSGPCELHASPVLAPQAGRSSPEPSTTLSEAFQLMTLREDHLPADVRMVTLAWEGYDTTLEPMELHGGADDEPPVTVLVGRQAPNILQPSFALELSLAHKFRVFFDVASDYGLAYNEGDAGLTLVPLEKEARGDMVTHSCKLERDGLQPISTGVWRIDPDRHGDEPRPASVEFLLRPQGFEIRIASAPVAAGTKHARSDSPGPSRAGVPGGQVSQLRLHKKPENPMIMEPSTQITIVSGTGKSHTITNRTFVLGPAGERVVFKGTHSKYPGLVAVKVIKAEKHDIREVMRLADDWEREVHFLNEVRHPSIVRFWEADPRFFAMVMEYYSTPDLAAICTDPGYYCPLSLKDATRVVREMASALDYLASKNILHNDIKPGNILFDRKRGAVLIDFGLATYVNENNLAGGTWPYIPPEAEKTKPFRGPEGEIYSLGVTALYLMRKVPLPERTMPRWTMFDNSPEYQEWRSCIKKGQKELRGKLGGIVKRMLPEQPAERITACQIMEALGDAGSM